MTLVLDLVLTPSTIAPHFSLNCDVSTFARDKVKAYNDSIGRNTTVRPTDRTLIVIAIASPLGVVSGALKFRIAVMSNSKYP